LSWATG
jgi:hypothetical protein